MSLSSLTTPGDMSSSSPILLSTATSNTSMMDNSSSVWDTGQNGTDLSELFNTTSGTPDRAPTPHWPVLALLVVMAVGLAGNLLVIVVVSHSPRLHVPFYLFTASLATSDLLKALTVMPLSILRLLLDGDLPPWMCWAWGRLYLGFTGLTLSHIIVALLHCHLALYKPLLFRHFSDPCSIAVQVGVAWVLPVLLLVPYMVFTGTGVLRVTCLPLDSLYFITGVFPSVVIPMLIAVVVYTQAVITVKTQKKVAQQMQSNKNNNSDVSSNGFVTYENSVASEDGVSPKVPHRALNGQPGLNGQPSLNGQASLNGQPPLNGQAANALNAQGGHISHHEVIIHDAKPYDDISGEDLPEKVHIHHEAELEADSTSKDDRVDATCDAPGNNANESNENIGSSEHIDQPCSPDSPDCTLEIPNLSNLEKECDQNAGCTKTPTQDDTDSNEQKDGCSTKKGEQNDDNTQCCNVVHVKCKAGKEALNEPLEDADRGVNLQLASFIVAQAGRLQGVDNPGYDEDDADLPLCESIKPRVVPPTQEEGEEEGQEEGGEGEGGEGSQDKGSPSTNGLQVCKSSSESSPYGASRTSSFSGEENGAGHRSILKRDRKQGSSTKSVTFTLPQGGDQTPKINRGRLLSCKYKTKNSNKIRNTKIDSKGDLPAKTGDGKSGCTEVTESLAKSADIRYMAQAQKDQGLRLRSRVASHGRHVRLLLGMLLVCVLFSAPHIVSMVVISYNLHGSWGQSTIVLSILEWLGFVPFIAYPFMYIAFSANFRTMLKTTGRKNAQ